MNHRFDVDELVSRIWASGCSDQEIASVTSDVDFDGDGLSRMTVWRIRTREVTNPSARSWRLLNLALVAIKERQLLELEHAKMLPVGEQ